MGAVPLQVPGSAVSVCPSCGLPEMVGGDVFAGAVAAAVTTTVWAEPALLEPTELVAVTVTRSVEPTSAFATGYVCWVAEAMLLQLAPALSQRRHWKAYEIGVAPLQVPGSAVSV